MIAESLQYLYPGITLGPVGEGADCAIVDDSKGPRIVEWRRQERQPTPDELKAAEPAALAVLQAEEAKRVESDTARSEAKQAYSELQPLLEHKDPAIALLAVIMQKHLLATLGR